MTDVPRATLNGLNPAQHPSTLHPNQTRCLSAHHDNKLCLTIPQSLLKQPLNIVRTSYGNTKVCIKQTSSSLRFNLGPVTPVLPAPHAWQTLISALLGFPIYCVSASAGWRTLPPRSWQCGGVMMANTNLILHTFKAAHDSVAKQNRLFCKAGRWFFDPELPRCSDSARGLDAVWSENQLRPMA